MTCPATIGSPWRMGMRVSCNLFADHDGPHWASVITDEVMWTGCNERFTAQESKRHGARAAQIVAELANDPNHIPRPLPNSGSRGRRAQ